MNALASNRVVDVPMEREGRHYGIVCNTPQALRSVSYSERYGGNRREPGNDVQVEAYDELSSTWAIVHGRWKTHSHTYTTFRSKDDRGVTWSVDDLLILRAPYTSS